MWLALGACSKRSDALKENSNSTDHAFTQKLQHQLLPVVQSCYSDLKNAFPNEKGETLIILTIDSDGSISAFSERSDSILSSPIVECLNKKFGQLIVDLPEPRASGRLDLLLTWE